MTGYDTWKLATPPEWDELGERETCDAAGCREAPRWFVENSGESPAPQFCEAHAYMLGIFHDDFATNGEEHSHG
jgi:hypothetical protein